MRLYKNILFAAALGLAITSCEETEDNGGNMTPEVDYKTEGYVVGSISTDNYFAGYVEEMPTGNIKATDFASFGRFRIQKAINGVMFGPDTDLETNKFVKYVIDKNSNEVERIGEIALPEYANGVAIINETTGLLSNSSDKEILIFNPTTMQVTGEIDMSAAEDREGFDSNGYTSLLYNEKVGKIYAVNYADIAATGQFYDAEEVRVEVIDATTLIHEKTIDHPNAEYAVFRGNTHEVIDEEGNTYLVAQGQYGLDGMVGANAPAGSRPQILKINTNSEFDTDYAFNPIDAVGYANNFFQMFTTLIYAGNNKAYGIGTAKADYTDTEMIDLLTKLGLGTITSEEYGKLIQLVLYSETSKLMEVDLTTKQVTEVAGTPYTAGFSYPMLYLYDDKLYHQVTSPSTGENAFYELDLNTMSNKQQFNVVEGGFAYQFIDLKHGF